MLWTVCNKTPVIGVRVERISDSCGFGVPRYHLEQERAQLPDWVARQGPEPLEADQAAPNRGIDGLAGCTGSRAADIRGADGRTNL